MTALKLQKIGNSLGIVLPRDVLARMRLAEGDTLVLTKVPGGYGLAPAKPHIEDRIASARRIMEKRRDVLRELAK